MDFQIQALAVILLGAAIIVAFERLFPYDKNQKFFREGFFNDLVMYSILQSYVLGVVIGFIIEWIDGSTDVSRLHLISDWPIWVQVVFFVVTHDFYIYWFHRAQHKSKFLWRIHEAHHSPKSVDWVAGSRSHSLEILINQTVEFTPIVLLGAAPEVAVIKGVISALWGMWIHSNIDARTGWLQYIINGPEMHRWHHSSYVPHGSTNYATKLAIWDWLFGTGYNPADQKPDEYGIAEVNFPKNYFLQHIYAFRPFKTDPTFTKGR
ncbi:MAG: fatty acid hydroxylase [Ectothiorhodospiraceae bacterium]|nr:fatty acid hydroxylase [Ectothiorhodospiraceae bacterium]